MKTIETITPTSSRNIRIEHYDQRRVMETIETTTPHVIKEHLQYIEHMIRGELWRS
jgi:hypothetical protein